MIKSGGTTQSLNAVSFVDPETGTAVGDSGAIVRTTDGGRSWVDQDSGVSAALHGVSFTDPRNGTVVGANGTILRTTDGGQTWVPQEPPDRLTPTLRAASFTDSDTGTAVGDGGAVLRTTDGGQTWVRQRGGVSTDLLSVSFVDADTGAAVGDGGTILTTTDGGQTWVFQNSGRTTQLWGVSFGDPDHGTAVGNTGQIMRTTDGGRTWTLQPSGTTRFLRAVSFIDANHGYVVGDGTILRTTDGGQTWSAESSGSTTSLRGVSFADVHTGVAVGRSGTIVGRVGVGPAVSLTPVTADLGATVVGGTSAARTITLRNIGNAGLTVGQLALSGPHFRDFVVEADACSGQPVPAAATCTIEIALAPSVVGERSAVLIVTSDAPSTPDPVPLRGVGLAPEPYIAVEPGSVAFEVDQGQRDRRAVTITNLGNEDLTFEVLDGAGCARPDWLAAAPRSGEVAPAASHQFDLHVDASGLAPGEHTVTMCLGSNDPDAATVAVPVALVVQEATADSGWSTFGDGVGITAARAVAKFRGDVYAGGLFILVDGVRANHIARWDGSRWSPLSGGTNGTVRAIAGSGPDLYVAGFFSEAGGVPARGVARWDGAQWHPVGSGLGQNVHDLAISGDHLYVSGEFPGGVARWDGTEWSIVDEGIDALNVPAIAVAGDEIYAGAAFQGVWKWDGEHWSSLGGPNGSVNTLSVVGDSVYAGGAFVAAGGTPANFIARWDGTRWHALGSGTGSNVFATAVMGDDVFAGGFFRQAGGTSANGVAGWDGEAWSALGSGIGSSANEGVSALRVAGNELFVGGNFLTAGGLPANRLAAWRDPDVVGVGADVVSGAGFVDFRDLFTTTAVSIRVDPGTGAGHVNAYRYDEPPVDPLGVVGDVSAYRWVLNQRGLATPFLADVRFTISQIPDHGLTDPERVTVYARRTPGTGRFVPLPTTYDPDTGVLTARTTGVGEFTFGIAAQASPRPGVISGTVTAVGCDGDLRPLADAIVHLQGRRGEVTLRTNFEGGFRWWLAPADNPLTIIVAGEGYIPQARSSRIIPNRTVVEDFTLQMICPTGG